MNSDGEWMVWITFLLWGIVLLAGCASPPPQAMCDALISRVDRAATTQDAEWAVKQFDRYRCAR